MTKHEIEILNVMRSRGKTAMDIALALHISVNTIPFLYAPPPSGRCPSGRSAFGAENPSCR